MPLLTKGSSVILTGSVASIKGFPSLSVYDATKAAVGSFARSWIVDLKGRAIRVSVLSPGNVKTPGVSKLITDEEKATAAALIPLGGSAYQTTWARPRYSWHRTIAPTSAA
jgi:NAD(P)-dependent dehydrogenase (short-subunit alcohol dehydrogenase family)